VKEKAGGRGASTSICDGKEPSEDTLCHLKGLGVCNEKKDKCAVKGILRFEVEVRGHSTWS